LRTDVGSSPAVTTAVCPGLLGIRLLS
jgi:hypothetical protein